MVKSGGGGVVWGRGGGGGGGGGGTSAGKHRKVATGSASLLGFGGIVSAPTWSGAEPREPSMCLTKKLIAVIRGEKWSKGAQ